MKTKMKVLAALLLSVFAITSASYGDTVFYNNVLTTSAPTSHVTGQSTTAPGIQYYNLYSLTVTTSGTYTFELSSLNTTGTPSNALDTWIAVFANAFNPVTPGVPQNSNDDFTGALTVLPGPFTANGLTATATGFSGAQPSSRLATVTLNLGTTYFVYVSSFRQTTFVGTGTTAQSTGAYYGGITGPGTISLAPVVVPEPSTAALLGLVGAGALGLGVWRKRKAA